MLITQKANSTSPEREPPPTREHRAGGVRNHASRLRLLLALAAVALAYFYRLDRPLLWPDEAETGILSRNILRCGYPTVFDGRNVSLFENGAETNHSLVRTVMPWSQFYLGASSLRLFGNHTAGLRILFALVGLLAFFPLYAVLKPRVKCPNLVTVLVLVAPQTVLFQRNARYYPILTLAYALLVWHLCASFKNPKVRWGVAALVMLLLFQAHSFAAACCAVSVVLFCALFRREALPVYLVAAAAGVVSWLAWARWVGPSVERMGWILTANFPSWCEQFARSLQFALVDFDVVGCVPLLFWSAMVVLLCRKGRRAWAEIMREPLVSFVGVSLLVQSVATAAVFGAETGSRYAILRYQPHLLVFALVAAFCALDRVIRRRSLFCLAAVVMVGCNLVTVSYWAGFASRHVPVSWFLPVYSEILRPQTSALDAVIARLRTEAAGTAKPDTVMVALPYWVQDTMIFYLGDSYLVRPGREPRAPAFDEVLRTNLGAEHYRQLFGKPEWVLDTLRVIESIPGYTNAAAFPSYRDRPDDGVRPELTRHTFLQRSVVANVILYRASGRPQKD